MEDREEKRKENEKERRDINKERWMERGQADGRRTVWPWDQIRRWLPTNAVYVT